MWWWHSDPEVTLSTFPHQRQFKKYERWRWFKCTHTLRSNLSVHTLNVRGIEYFKYVQEFYTLVCYCVNISMPLNMTHHKTKRDWLINLPVIWPLGQALANQSIQSSQTFCRQSEGLATRGYSPVSHSRDVAIGVKGGDDYRGPMLRAEPSPGHLHRV